METLQDGWSLLHKTKDNWEYLESGYKVVKKYCYENAENVYYNQNRVPSLNANHRRSKTKECHKYKQKIKELSKKRGLLET